MRYVGFLAYSRKFTLYANRLMFIYFFMKNKN